MLTIIESGSKAWAFAATNGDVRIFSREEVGEWSELVLSEGSEQVDGDGSLILEALYEQHAAIAPEEEPEAEEEEEEPEAEAEEEDEEPEEEEEEEKPLRRRRRTRAKKK